MPQMAFEFWEGNDAQTAAFKRRVILLTNISRAESATEEVEIT
tara:strand:- start:569 stop:697 length:129 start_codon:yes stop_codon:yes gene_type:complete